MTDLQMIKPFLNLKAENISTLNIKIDLIHLCLINKRKSLGNALATGVKGSKNFRSESAMAAHKTTAKNNYRPSSAFATHYTKSRTKSKKQTKQSQNKLNVADNIVIQNKIKSIISSD